MRGIAAARAQQARAQLGAVDSYAESIARAIGRIVNLVPAPRPQVKRRSARTALIIFTAEQGFVGAFTERVIDAVQADLAQCELLLIGTAILSSSLRSIRRAPKNLRSWMKIY
jgi:F-type H+-transporting ATPase subunit gamma